MREEDYFRAAFRSVVTLLCPCPHLLAIWRIAKDGMLAPVLMKTVVFFGEEERALGVIGSGARVEGEIKLSVQTVVKVLWRRPFL
jgi:hypothetical protein